MEGACGGEPRRRAGGRAACRPVEKRRELFCFDKKTFRRRKSGKERLARRLARLASTRLVVPAGKNKSELVRFSLTR